MSVHDNETAFPVVIPGFLYADGSYEPSLVEQNGMSLRDFFAAMAMQGELASQTRQDDLTWSAKELAKRAYDIADAMMKERSIE